MSNQCHALHLQHGALKWICAHCEALIEECSRILKGALVGAVTTSSPQISNTRVKHTMKEKNGKEKITSTKRKKPRKGDTVKPLESIEVTARIEQLEKGLRDLQRSTQVLSCRTRNVLLHNFVEPMICDTKARRKADRRHVQDVFRLADILANTP
ncbi:unnamed protein product [Echinostoma caproni]|uniref:Phorbol-ester/DAG-type domain-containing protein n=1 Tax=Echinostoma caproni TaxID=27848 RepID=A0A183B022_9TREM|nr:unnamed protein product [Echinostoma caproni]